MSANNHFSGVILIDPPLAWHQFKDHPMRPGPANRHDVALVVVTETRETDEGELTTRTAVGVAPHEDGYSGYRITDNIQDLVDAFPGHAFTDGRIDARGEEGDHWRIKVVNRRVVEFVATLSWPEGSE